MQRSQSSAAAGRTDDQAAPGVATARPLRIRGRFMTAIVLQIAGRADDSFDAALAAQMRLTPNFFHGAPLALDLSAAEGLEDQAEFDALLGRMRAKGLALFAVQGGTGAQTEAARAAGLLPLPPGSEIPAERAARRAPAPKPAAETAPQPAAQTAAAPAAAPAPASADHAHDDAPRPRTKIITQPVRSGQTIFADEGDLIVVASVGSGAELIAAGSIHVYGTLRGRALAGVTGDTTARIFAQDLDAELLAIAGLWRTSEDIGPEIRRGRIQAYLQGDSLCIDPLK